MTLTRFRLLFAAAILVAINLALIAMSLPTLRHSLLPETIGVTTARIPIAIQVLESDGSPAQGAAIECVAVLREDTVLTTDAQGRANGLLAVMSEKHFVGPVCIQQTYNTADFEAFEVRPDGTRRRLYPTGFSRTAGSMAGFFQRSAIR